MCPFMVATNKIKQIISFRLILVGFHLGFVVVLFNSSVSFSL